MGRRLKRRRRRTVKRDQIYYRVGYEVIYLILSVLKFEPNTISEHTMVVYAQTGHPVLSLPLDEWVRDHGDLPLIGVF